MQLRRVLLALGALAAAAIVTTPERAKEYVEHLNTFVFPQLRAMAGHRGTFVVQKELGEKVEFSVLTVWESMDAIHNFADENPEIAVVHPEQELF